MDIIMLKKKINQLIIKKKLKVKIKKCNYRQKQKIIRYFRNIKIANSNI